MKPTGLFGLILLVVGIILLLYGGSASFFSQRKRWAGRPCREQQNGRTSGADRSHCRWGLYRRRRDSARERARRRFGLTRARNAETSCREKRRPGNPSPSAADSSRD